MHRSIRTAIIAATTAAAIVVPAASASAAKLDAPGSTSAGKVITVKTSKLQRSKYSLTFASFSTSGRVCGRRIGRIKRAGRGDRLRWRVQVPRRLPCYRGQGGNGPRDGSVRVRPGEYGLLMGRKTQRFFWSRDASFAMKGLRIAG